MSGVPIRCRNRGHWHSPDASLLAADVSATAAAGRHDDALHGGYVDSALRLDAATRAGGSARTLAPTVDIAVIAAAADPHLHRTTPAVVEPIARLAQPPQCPSQDTGQCSGKAGIKDLHKRLSQALRTEGSGGSDANLETLGPRFSDRS